MKLIIEDILSQKGLKWKDLADRVGKDQSNLKASLKKNPTLSALNEVADALGLEMTELFESEKKKPAALGYVVIDGKTYELSEPSEDTLQIPRYDDYSELRDKVKYFVKTSVSKQKPNAFMGIMDKQQLFSLAYDGEETFLLSMMIKAGYNKTIAYDANAYANEWDGDKPIWNIPDVTQEIINDLEGAMILKINN